MLNIIFILILSSFFSGCGIKSLSADQDNRQLSDISILTNRTTTENSLWNGWKSRYKHVLESGTIIVDQSSNRAFSEAMGHALLLSVQFNDQDFFDAILNGLTYFLNNHGLYAWEIMIDGNKFSDPNKNVSASETELNVLFALIQAKQLVKFGIWKDNGYLSKAENFEDLVWQYEVTSFNGFYIFLPSDGKENPYWPIVYENGLIKAVAYAPTYFNPAFISEFALAFPDHPWHQLRLNGLEFMHYALNHSQALLANDSGVSFLNPIADWVWIQSSSSDNFVLANYFDNPYGPDYCNEFDTIRVPLYLGLDYFWNNNIEVKELLVSFNLMSGVDNVSEAYVGASTSTPLGYHNNLAIGMYGIANKVNNDQEFKNYISSEIHSSLEYFGDTPQYYYNQTFILYSYLVLNNRFLKLIY